MTRRGVNQQESCNITSLQLHSDLDGEVDSKECTAEEDNSQSFLKQSDEFEIEDEFERVQDEDINRNYCTHQQNEQNELVIGPKDFWIDDSIRQCEQETSLSFSTALENIGKIVHSSPFRNSKPQFMCVFVLIHVVVS